MKNSNITFVLIICKEESIKCVVEQLSEIDVVKETTLVEGQWNILVKLESNNLDYIRDAIRWKLRKMNSIESTLTLVKYM